MTPAIDNSTPNIPTIRPYIYVGVVTIVASVIIVALGYVLQNYDIMSANSFYLMTAASSGLYLIGVAIACIKRKVQQPTESEVSLPKQTAPQKAPASPPARAEAFPMELLPDNLTSPLTPVAPRQALQQLPVTPKRLVYETPSSAVAAIPLSTAQAPLSPFSGDSLTLSPAKAELTNYSEIDFHRDIIGNEVANITQLAEEPKEKRQALLTTKINESNAFALLKNLKYDDKNVIVNAVIDVIGDLFFDEILGIEAQDCVMTLFVKATHAGKRDLLTKLHSIKIDYHKFRDANGDSFLHILVRAPEMQTVCVKKDDQDCGSVHYYNDDFRGEALVADCEPQDYSLFREFFFNEATALCYPNRKGELALDIALAPNRFMIVGNRHLATAFFAHGKLNNYSFKYSLENVFKNAFNAWKRYQYKQNHGFELLTVLLELCKDVQAKVGATEEDWAKFLEFINFKKAAVGGQVLALPAAKPDHPTTFKVVAFEGQFSHVITSGGGL